MSATDRKKKHERFLLEQFLETAKLRAEVLNAKDEAPDFIARFEGRLIGIEVTRLFISHDDGPYLSQAQESMSARIVSRAQQLYQASGAPWVHVSVHFDPGCDLRNLDRDSAASTLAEFVKGLDLSVDQHVQWRRESFDGPLPYEVTFLNMLGVPSAGMAHWSAPRAGWVAPLTVEALQARIDQKAPLLPKYTQRVVENWLLLVAEGNRPSQFFDTDTRSTFNASMISSPFARTFFYGHMGGTVFELGA